MTSFSLKLIALAAMLIDHIGAVLFPDYNIFRIIGRASFPIYCFLISEGFLNTRSVKNYLARLAMFAVISEVPYDLVFNDSMFYPQKQNIFFTLATGLIALCIIRAAGRRTRWLLLLLLPLCIAAELLGFSYGAYGVLLIVSMYIFRWSRMAKTAGMSLLAAGYYFAYQNFSQMYSLTAALPICLYNGRKGPTLPKFVFYLFYPLHVLALYAVKQLFF